MSQMENIQCPSCGSPSFTKQGELIECNHCGNIYRPSWLQGVQDDDDDDSFEDLDDDPLEELQDERTIKKLIPEVEELEQEFQDKSEEYERLKENFHEYNTEAWGCSIFILFILNIFLFSKLYALCERLRLL